MSTLDWVIIAVYMFGMIALGFYLGRNQRDMDSYYVGERRFKWWMVGISTMATQTSAISFISIPAFVALKENGGLSWLQYELAVPLAMIVIMVFLVPFFRELKLISIYEYLDQRFNVTVRYVVAVAFLLSRGLGTGVALYAAAIVLSVCAGLPLWSTILLLGVATVIYDVAGGIRAVVVSDVIQMAVLVAGLVVCVMYAADLSGGLQAIFTSMPEERMQAIVPSSGFSGDSQVPFWAFLFGGFFLYISYYGTDQSQVQRGLAAASSSEVKKSLMLNGLSRFPLTLLYVVLGMAMYSAYQHSAELRSLVPADRPDYLVPYFIVTELSPGLRGILFAALLSATMSSLDSSLNSLSAVTMRDFLQPFLRDDTNVLTASRVVTLAWGVVITLFAFIVGDISDTVIEGINKIGSAFYGPILATFLLGILTKRIGPVAVVAGIVVGVIFNLVLWKGYAHIHWMWWNVLGFAVTVVTALALSFVLREKISADFNRLTLGPQQLLTRERSWLVIYGILALYFAALLGVLIVLTPA